MSPPHPPPPEHGAGVLTPPVAAGYKTPRFAVEPWPGYGGPTSLWLAQLPLGWWDWQSWGWGWGLQAWWRPTLLLRGTALLVWGEAGGGQDDQCGLREESRSQVCSWAMGPCVPEPASWKPGLLLTCSYLRR